MKIANGMWILLGLVWVGLYWPLLAGAIPAFRDAFHFYYPLEYWLDQQARQGDFFPQANPLDGTGTNLVGETSTGLFYPGRCLWWLPALSVAQRMGLVLMLHTSLAGLGAAYAAKRLRLGAAPQLLCAAAYSLSGPVFFQHVNPIFLISSAWLPWALAECCVLARSTSDHSRIRWGVWIVACSMMLLGGDPQGTLHCGLITAVAVACSAWSVGSIRYLARTSLRFGLAVLVVAGLTAVQALPTWYWYQATARLPEIASSNVVDQLPELLQSIEPTNYDVARGSPYAYSVAPWHGVTLLWSNSLGHLLPKQTRFLTAWPAEPRMWTASLSIGLISLLLAVAGFSLRHLRHDAHYLWLIALLSGTAMLGNYAPVWMLRSGLRWLGLSTLWLPGDEVGGTYWVMTQLLPGYEAFRYPAKWSPIFACSLTLCAAHGLNHWEQTRTVIYRYARNVAVISVLLGLVVGWLSLLPVSRAAFSTWAGAATPDAWLNSIDPTASISNVLLSLAIGSLIALVVWSTCKRGAHGWQPWFIVVLVTLELGWSAHQWLVTVPASQVTVRYPDPGADQLNRVWAAVGQANIVHDQWPLNSLADKLQYQQQFALAKLHLLGNHTGNLSAFMTLTPKALAQVRHQLALHDRLLPENARLDEALAWLGVQWRLVRNHRYLQWQAIDHARPLIEWMPEHGSENTLRVKYLSASRLECQMRAANQGRLVVRLFQDGGWRATMHDDAGGKLAVVPTPSHLGLFQSLDVPAGNWNIQLHYQAPGLQLGAWISACTLLLFGLCILLSPRLLLRLSLTKK